MEHLEVPLRCPFARHGQLEYEVSHSWSGKRRCSDRDEDVEEHRAVVVVGSECRRV